MILASIIHAEDYDKYRCCGLACAPASRGSILRPLICNPTVSLFHIYTGALNRATASRMVRFGWCKLRQRE
jgi:hypothetical protein